MVQLNWYSNTICLLFTQCNLLFFLYVYEFISKSTMFRKSNIILKVRLIFFNVAKKLFHFKLTKGWIFVIQYGTFLRMFFFYIWTFTLKFLFTSDQTSNTKQKWNKKSFLNFRKHPKFTDFFSWFVSCARIHLHLLKFFVALSLTKTTTKTIHYPPVAVVFYLKNALKLLYSIMFI